MNLWSDFDCEMHPVPLDLDTADRLLAGTVAPEDAPPGYANVARLLESAAAQPTAEELSRETEVVAMVAAAVRSSSSIHSVSPRRFFMPFALSRPRITAAFVALTLACTAGLASAGSLPGAAQDIASSMLAKVGISVPGPDEHAGTHPSVRGSSSDASSDAVTRSDIAELATTTDLTGVDKGAAISSAASDGKSQAGQHGSASGGSAPVDTPNSGGTGTADTASGGKSSQGTSTADAASGGASSAGSGNASSGEETADSASGGHSSAGSDNGSAGQSHKP
jgi:hypothetical protein